MELENSFIDPVNAPFPEGYVAFKVPFVYVSVDENAKSHAAPQLRAMEAGSLIDFVGNYYKRILDSDTKKQTELCKEVCDLLIQGSMDSEVSNNRGPYEKIIQLLKQLMAETDGKLDTETEFADFKSDIQLTFDRIRKFETDPVTHIVTKVENWSWLKPDGVSSYDLYSQVPNDQVKSIREALNDTDLNRVHLVLNHFSKMLCFEIETRERNNEIFYQSYVVESTVKFINTALFFMLLVLKSSPLKGYCANDLTIHYLGLTLDAVIRSRVIQAWQNDPSKQTLMADLKINHEREHPMVKLCKLPTAEARAQEFLSQLKKDEKMKRGPIGKLTYSKYFDLLNQPDNIVTAEGKTYYKLSSQFLHSLSTAPVLTELFDYLQQTSQSTDDPMDWNLIHVDDPMG